jgi:CRP-like cAMP-binding protein
VVLRQGDLGRDFFIIATGEVGVTIDGRRKPGELGAGEFFGEIALLRRIPRTATITAETDVRVLVLRDNDFLAAVTGGVDGRAVMSEIASRYDDLAA